MIELKKLLEIDTNLELLDGSLSNISGISSYLTPNENSIVFIKSLKYLSDLSFNESMSSKRLRTLFGKTCKVQRTFRARSIT